MRLCCCRLVVRVNIASVIVTTVLISYRVIGNYVPMAPAPLAPLELGATVSVGGGLEDTV